MSTLTRHDQRRAELILLLRSLRDVGETLQRGDAGGRFEPGSKILLMPSAWHAGCPKNCIENRTCRSSYAELLISLATVRKLGPHHYWHLSQRYLESERSNRDLVNRGGRYFEAIPRPIGEMRRFECGAPLGRNVEVVKAVADARVPVLRKAGDARAVVVRAIVERWDAGVELRPLGTALDALSFLMPRVIRFPREVVAA